VTLNLVNEKTFTTGQSIFYTYPKMKIFFSNAPNRGIDDLIGACYWLKTSDGALNCSRFKPVAALHFFHFYTKIKVIFRVHLIDFLDFQGFSLAL
jgi:hypothetical protein